jgi:hypothetical protein
MTQNTFVEDLQRALGPNHIMPLSLLLNGVYRGKFTGPVDYLVLQELLRRHDRRLFVQADSVEFRPVLNANDTCAPTPPETDTIGTPVTTVEIQAAKCEKQMSTSIRLVRYIRPIATSNALDVLQQRSDTLKLIIDDGVLILHQIIPTNHRGGLAHHKRMGQIGSTITGKHPTQHSRPSPTSHAAVLARARRDSRVKTSRWWRIMKSVFPANK